MEGLTRNLSLKRMTLENDTSSATRLSQRPSQHKGTAYEDFGSDFGSRPSSRTSQPPRKLASSRHASSSKSTGIPRLDGLSDDEIDFLSSSSHHESESPPSFKKQQKGHESRLTDTSVPIAIDRHQTATDYKAVDLKKLKFRKKSSTATPDADGPKSSQEQPSDCAAGPSSSAKPFLTSKYAGPSSLPVSESEPERPKRREKTNHPLRERIPNQGRVRPPKSHLPPWDNSDQDEKETEKTPRPPRPRPRPAYQSAVNGKMAKSQTVADMQPSASQEEKSKQEKPQPVAHSHTLQLLDAQSPKSGGDAEISKSSLAKGKAREREPAKVKSKDNRNSREDTGRDKLRELNPIRAIFEGEPPRNSTPPQGRKHGLSAFPMPSPLSSPFTSRASSPPRKSHVKDNSIVVSSDEDSESGSRLLRPFPMATQMLESLKQGSAKRTAAGSEADIDSGAYRKRQRRGSHDKAKSHVDDLLTDSDLDDIFLDPSVDPATLCHWCDEPLPTNPTPHLTSLIAAARRRSYPDDRPTNPLGLRAPPAVFVGVCQRHRFERIWIPRARKRGWPTGIDWAKLGSRVLRLKAHLQAIADDVDDDFAPGAQGGKGKERAQRRSRKENEFWQELVTNVRQQGSRQTTGVRGQFLHFNKTQPGYYGELGYVIIHQTLCNLFPPANFDPAAALPLTPADFIAQILVPEAALNLIMEDLGQSRADALKTLRDSVQYGVAMFPADEGEGGKGSGDEMVLTAGERIIMERARARRKELEEEERQEEEEARRAEERMRQTDTEPDMDTDMDMGAETDDAPPSSQSSKPESKMKPTSTSSNKSPAMRVTRSRSRRKALESDTDIIELSSDTAGSSDASESRASVAQRRKNGRAEPPPAEPRDPPTDHGGATPRAKPRPRPRAVGKAASRQEVRNRTDRHGQSVNFSDPPDAPSPQLSVPFVSWDRQKQVHVRRGETETTIDTTPRPKAKSSRLASSLGSREDAGGGPRFPIQMARERQQERRVAAELACEWRGRLAFDGR
ncbi:RTC4-like domain-containing protein [Trametes elegans]|nr:RTC4-like domain-containing protein [Trametes elegans]